MSNCGVQSKDIEAFLKAIRTGQSADDNPLLGDDIFPYDDSERAAPRRIQLSDRLSRIITETYLDCAARDGYVINLPQTRIEAGHRVQNDFSKGNATLESWSALYYRYVFPINFSVEELAAYASVVPQQLRRRMNTGFALLSDRLCQAVYRNQHAANLPVFDRSRLIGIQERIATLKSLVEPLEGPYIVSLAGMGGIGKTTLARAYVDSEVGSSKWDHIIWVSARRTDDAAADLTPELESLAETEILRLLAEAIDPRGKDLSNLEELRGYLKKYFSNRRCLAIIDNLESVINYRSLILQLFDMAYPSKFLITSRLSLNEFDFIREIPVTEMPPAQALELFHAEVKRRGRHEMLTPEQFRQIFALVGGNPLAIKLVAAQCMLMPLRKVLTSLREATIGIDRLFRYLYMRIWNALSEPAKMLLMSFLAIDPEGEELDFIQKITGLPFEELVTQLKELDKFSMLEMSGTFETPRYYLHHLTTTFLQTDILNRW